jgi:hypothetical protein
MRKTGLLIIIIGFGLIILTVFTIFTRESVAKIGDFQITRNQPYHLNWSPLIGVAIMGIGGIVTIIPSKKS